MAIVVFIGSALLLVIGLAVRFAGDHRILNFVDYDRTFDPSALHAAVGRRLMLAALVGMLLGVFAWRTPALGVVYVAAFFVIVLTAVGFVMTAAGRFDENLQRSAGGRSAVLVPDAAEVFGTPLSREADEFLETCNTRFNDKQKQLADTWLRDHDRYDVDLERGVLRLSHAGRALCEFDVAVIGSMRAASNTWEWAWHNPNVDRALAVSRQTFESTAATYGLNYLAFGMMPVPDAQFGWYLSGIALHLAGGEGVYQADGEGLQVYLLLRSPRPVSPDPLPCA